MTALFTTTKLASTVAITTVATAELQLQLQLLSLATVTIGAGIKVLGAAAIAIAGIVGTAADLLWRRFAHWRRSSGLLITGRPGVRLPVATAATVVDVDVLPGFATVAGCAAIA